jgi:protein-tyrosine phosphatase
MTGGSDAAGNLASTVRDLPRWLARTSTQRAVEWTLPRYVRHVDHPALDASGAVEAVGTDGTLLFLCLGNVCRSPFAGRYVRARCDEFTVTSAGLSTTPGRPSPDRAVDAAAAHDVDLSDHRAREADVDLVVAADLVFLMDPYNYLLYRRQFPDSLDRAVFLGAFESSDPADAVAIDDPYGETAATFERVYGRIAAAADDLLARL